ncbi:MAG: hypothetical protein ABSE73_08250 [Planctomycetota bacterium]
MRRILFIAMTSGLLAGASEALKPVVDGPEGRRAFEDLAACYAGKAKEPPCAQALEELRAGDEAKRLSAGQYLLALLKQGFADETNGRGPYQKQPFFGSNPVSVAREVRKKVAAAFGERAGGAEALDAALWLIDEEKQAENQAAGMRVLRRVQVPRATEVFKALLAQPHPNAEVAKGVIEEAAQRKLAALAPDIQRLCGHYRTAVREAARKAAPALGLAPAPDFKPEEAFTPWLEQQLKDIAAMVLVEIPKEAAWTRFEVPVTEQEGQAKPRWRDFSGWLLGEKDGKQRTVDWFAQEAAWDKAATKMTPRSWSDEAQALLELRAGKEREAPAALSRRGGLTAQFEPHWISLPEGLVAAWSFVRGDKASAAAVLFPRLDGMSDDRWLAWVVRDYLGNMYYQEMLEAFSHRRDYPRVQELARHLAKPVFDGYNYQPRAKELLAQLEKRGDDFKAFVLPEPAQWEKQKKEQKLSREQQVKFLAKHLRLLNCIQLGQPGGINYNDEQFAGPRDSRDKTNKTVINPYNELQALKLEISELPWLVPFLADENYMPTFNYWRDFHPRRTFHQVNWAVGNVVNDAAHRDLAELGAYFALDDAGKKQHIQKILDWCKTNSAKTREQLLLEVLETSKDWREVGRGAGEAVRGKVVKAFPLLARRMSDFPKNRADIAELCCALEAPEAAAEARKWLKDANATVRFYAALILIRSSPQGAKPEGLDELQELLNRPEEKGEMNAFNAKEFFPCAIDGLLAAKHEAALKLACSILDQPDFVKTPSARPVVQRLFLAGRQEALDFMLQHLDNADSTGKENGEWKGQKVERALIVGDDIAKAIAHWRQDNGYHYETLAPDDERAKEREALKGWLKEQFALLKAGKNPEMNTNPPPIERQRWKIDAP